LAKKKLSESETQQEEEFRFSELVEHTQDLIFRYGRDPLGCEYINPAVKDMLGYTPEEFYADPQLALKIVHPDDRHSLEANFQDVATLTCPHERVYLLS
jgi:PAS domain S-box-containing protein